MGFEGKTPGSEGFTEATSDLSAEKCSLCGNTFSRNMMLQFGEKWICAQCKPNYLQMLQQGISTSGQMRYGGFWIRGGARIIDAIILQVINYIVTFALALVFAFKTPSRPDEFGIFFIIQMCVALSLGIFYEVWFLGKYRATPGKMICGLSVVRPDGSGISYMRAFGRHLATTLSALILCIGYIMAGFDSEKRTLHDRICDTRVIRK